MSHFDFEGIEDANVFDRGAYLPPDGIYGLKVIRMLVKNARKVGPSFIAEHEVVHSTHPDIKPGAKRSWFQKLADTDVAYPAILEYMGALLGIDRDDKEAWKEFKGQIRDILNEAANFEGKPEDHPLHGETVKVTTWNKKTNQGKDFTVHDWEIWSEDAGWEHE
jgi:hypothetical protein